MGQSDKGVTYVACARKQSIKHPVAKAYGTHVTAGKGCITAVYWPSTADSMLLRLQAAA